MPGSAPVPEIQVCVCALFSLRLGGMQNREILYTSRLTVFLSMIVYEPSYLFWLLFRSFIVPDTAIWPGPEAIHLVTMKGDKIPSRDQQMLLVVHI